MRNVWQGCYYLVNIYFFKVAKGTLGKGVKYVQSQ